MRKTIVNGICLLLMAVGAWQCTPSSEYRLVDSKEIHWIYRLNQDVVKRNTRYSYKDGILVSRIDIDRDWTTNKDDSTCIEYETNIYDDRIDSVETTWKRYRNDSLRHVHKTIRSYSLDGVIMKNVTYDLSDSGWEEGVCTNYNASGQKTDESYHGQSFKWYYYDSLNRYTGQRDQRRQTGGRDAARGNHRSLPRLQLQDRKRCQGDARRGRGRCPVRQGQGQDGQRPGGRFDQGRRQLGCRKLLVQEQSRQVDTPAARMNKRALWNGCGRWIRTTEGASQQIYSLPSLTA